MSDVHRYSTRLRWSGSTALGYDAYDRRHVVEARPAETSLELSGDAAFGGDPSRLNPEQLFVVAASSCQLLSFLAVAARARVDVLAYEDDAEALMPEHDRPVRVTEIHLRPRITVASPASLDRVVHYVEQAHRECYIANSVKTEITVTPEIRIVG